MTLEILDDAEREFVLASLWYEDKERGLGKRFRDEIARVLLRILDDPLLWRARPSGYRRVNCPAFPYYVAYVIRGDKIVVMAIAHERRKPDYWLRPRE